MNWNLYLVPRYSIEYFLSSSLHYSLRSKVLKFSSQNIDPFRSSELFWLVALRFVGCGELARLDFEVYCYVCDFLD